MNTAYNPWAPAFKAESKSSTETRAAELVTVTPELAAKWLESNAANIRPVAKYRVTDFANMMMAGRWTLDPMPIIFRKDGTLANGQHRLHAVVKSGTSQRFFVLRDWDGMEEYEGSKRNGAVYLSQNGIAKGSHVQAFVSLYFRTKHGTAVSNLQNAQHLAPKAYEMPLAFESLGPTAPEAVKAAMLGHIGSYSACAVAAYVYLLAGADLQAVRYFFSESAKGGDGKGTPTTALFRAGHAITKELSGHQRSSAIYAATTYALSKHLAGEPCQIARRILTLPEKYEALPGVWKPAKAEVAR